MTLNGFYKENMSQTITEKILAAHAGLKTVHPGQLIEAKVDLALANDITAPIALEVFHEAGGKKVFDPKKVVWSLIISYPTRI